MSKLNEAGKKIIIAWKTVIFAYTWLVTAQCGMDAIWWTYDPNIPKRNECSEPNKFLRLRYKWFYYTLFLPLILILKKSIKMSQKFFKNHQHAKRFLWKTEYKYDFHDGQCRELEFDYLMHFEYRRNEILPIWKHLLRSTFPASSKDEWICEWWVV